MYLSRATTLAVRRAVVVGTCTALALTAVPAEAAKTKKLGKVQNLTMKITKPDTYALAADWDALAGATRYRVVLTNSVDDTRVVRETSNDEWTFRRSALDEGDTVTVQVIPFRETAPRRGTSDSITKTVPDVVAPTGTYTVDVEFNTGNATITESAVSDDVVSRTIDWGDGTVEAVVPGSAPTYTHTYEGGPAVYKPTVTLVDDADLTSVISAGKAIVFDTDAPSGEFAVRSSTEQTWARWTKVSVAQESIWDDASADGDIARVVHWGDGSTTRWVGTATPTHVYKQAGAFQPTVRLTDEAGKTADVAAGTVEVRVDEAGPRVVVKKPKKKAKRKSVDAWRTLRGTAVDEETGVRSVAVKVVQRRGKRWFAYRAPAKSWVKAATKRGALRKARVGVVRPADAAWRMRVKNLRKGTLIVVARGRDNVGNPSTKFVRKQVLNRR